MALVIPQPPDFSLAASPGSRTTAPGGSVIYTASTSGIGGFAGDVALSLSGLTGAQATWSFAPPAIASGSGASQLTVTTAASLAPGSYPLTITAASGSIVHTAHVTLVVPDFSLGASPASRTTTPGTAVTYVVSVGAINGFTGAVSLSLSGLTTAQATWSFAPASISTKGSAQLMVTPASSLAPGSYPLTVTGTSGSIVHTAHVTLIVTSPADFGVSVSPSSLTVTAGLNVSATVAVSSQGGFAGSVSLSANGLPSLATASFAPNPVAAPGASTFTVRTSRSTPRGTFTLTVTGRSGALSHGTPVTLVVR
jgi:hypothetical protein